MKLLRTFPKVAFEFGLASWQRLGLREQTPRFATCFGDLFLESLDGWWFLDTIEGTLELRWTSAVTMYADLESHQGRADYLMDDLVRDAQGRGIHLGPDDVYTFNPHPALGGELGVNGLGTMRFELALNWLGQVHERVLHSSGKVRLPPMPADDRRTPTLAREPVRSDDETFDVPFEQYLATGAVATVPAPPPDDGRHRAFEQAPARNPFGSGQLSRAAHSYESPSYAPLDDPPEQLYQTEPWSGHDADAPLWSGQTQTAHTWPALDQALSPSPMRYDAPDHPLPPALPDPSTNGATGQDENGHMQHAEAQPARPVLGGHPWGGQTAPVGAGSGPPPPSTEDPFTAWDDLWRKH